MKHLLGLLHAGLRMAGYNVDLQPVQRTLFALGKHGIEAQVANLGSDVEVWLDTAPKELRAQVNVALMEVSCRLREKLVWHLQHQQPMDDRDDDGANAEAGSGSGPDLMEQGDDDDEGEWLPGGPPVTNNGAGPEFTYTLMLDGATLLEGRRHCSSRENPDTTFLSMLRSKVQAKKADIPPFNLFVQEPFRAKVKDLFWMEGEGHVEIEVRVVEWSRPTVNLTSSPSYTPRHQTLNLEAFHDIWHAVGKDLSAKQQEELREIISLVNDHRGRGLLDVPIPVDHLFPRKQYHVHNPSLLENLAVAAVMVGGGHPGVWNDLIKATARFSHMQYDGLDVIYCSSTGPAAGGKLPSSKARDTALQNRVQDAATRAAGDDVVERVGTIGTDPGMRDYNTGAASAAMVEGQAAAQQQLLTCDCEGSGDCCECAELVKTWGGVHVGKAFVGYQISG